MSFSTMPSTHGFVFAVAMAAVSGAAVILLALKLHKSFPAPPLLPPDTKFQPETSSSPPRPCISSGEKKVNKKKKKKRVRFAKDVMEPSANNEEFRRKMASSATNTTVGVTPARSGMPANRVALYNGILRDRVVHRLGYSFLVN